MSFQTYHIYGYGVKVDEIKGVTVDKLQKLLSLAPKYEEEVNDWLKDCDIDSPTLEDYYEYDQDYCLGLATILSEVILEVEGIYLTPCEDFDGNQYLLYEPRYPWTSTEKDKIMTTEKLNEIFTKYVSVLTDEMPLIDGYSVENGG